MNEKPSNHEFIKSNDEYGWRDLGEFAHEILVKRGENHPIEKCETLVDYTWHDLETGDDLRLRAADFGPESEYVLDVVDGSLIDHRRRYGFSAKSAGVQVFDDNYQRLIHEEETQGLLETYVMQRLDTSRTVRPETNSEGVRRFWNLAARYAIDSVVNEGMMGQLSRLEEGRLKNLFRENIVDVVAARQEFRYLPKGSIYSAIVQKGHDSIIAMSQRQLEAKKEE